MKLPNEEIYKKAKNRYRAKDDYELVIELEKEIDYYRTKVKLLNGGTKKIENIESYFQNLFEHYDDELLKYLNFEIRLENYKIAEFNNFGYFCEYIGMLNSKSKKIRWFFFADKTLVFDYYN